MGITEIVVVYIPLLWDQYLQLISLFFLINAYFETQYYFAVVPLESIVFLFSYSDDMIASCNLQR